MKFLLELQLNKSRTDVWRVFDNPDNMNKWQPTLIKIERISGISGQPGAVTKLTYKNREREFSLTEKVTYRAEPERLDGIYENEFANNVVRNTFIEQERDGTLWRVETEFKFKTILMRIISPFVKKNLVTNTQKNMQRFKNWVENS